MEQDLAFDANSIDSWKAWLIDWMARELEIDHSKVETGRAFLSYGLDSVQAMTMVGDIESKLGARLPPTLALVYPDVNALSAHLAAQLTAAPSSAASPAKIEELLARIDSLSDQDVDSLLNQLAD